MNPYDTRTMVAPERPGPLPPDPPRQPPDRPSPMPPDPVPPDRPSPLPPDPAPEPGLPPR